MSEEENIIVRISISLKQNFYKVFVKDVELV